MKQSYKTTFLLWVILILLFVTIYNFYSKFSIEPQEMDFSTFMRLVEKQEVKSVKIKGLSYTGELTNGTKFSTTGIVGENITNKLISNNVIVSFEKEEQSSIWVQVLTSWLPMVFLIVIFILFMRQMTAGQGKALSFGKSRARMISPDQRKITFDDVAGVDEAKEELEEIIEFLKDPKKFTRLGGRIPKGVLLVGPPGTGKTLLAKAIAGEAGVPFFSISGSDFVEMFVGVGASRVRDLFEQGKKNAPCIIFIDEIDAVGRHRGAGLGGGHDEREQTLNQLLVEMDGFESNEGIILVAATNRPDVLDPALLRPGRFDRRVVVPRPDLKGRIEILKVHTRKVPLGPDVDIEIIARGTPGFVGADIENLVNEAALLAARKNKTRVDAEDFDEAKDKVLMGTARKSLIISEQEKLTTAYHEAGHTLVAKLLPNSDPVHKVSIIPRGTALGVTQQLPQEDKYNINKEYANNRIAILLAGRVAEEIVFKQQTTGAGNDIQQATKLASKMVCDWGMSERLGPVSFSKEDEEVFLGRDFVKTRAYSEYTAQQIDNEIREIIHKNYERAKELINLNLDKLERIAKALLDYESIDGSEVDLLMEGKQLTRAKPEKRVISLSSLEKKKDLKDRINDLVSPPVGGEKSNEPSTA
ncbi:MAG: ATP-dependent zinc metalloprotease FtsH [Deltaproteobacteria bacterium]|nr:ATP-dependent zinc metalloprotease FtsH [Deltaproteobacteria bacterium]